MMANTSIEEFYNDENKSLSTPHLPVEAFRDKPGSLLLPNTTPVEFQASESKPGYFETLGHAFSQYNEFAQAGRFIEREAEFLHPAEDSVPDDFNPKAFDHLKDYPPNYWGFISEAKSPKELQARQNYVSEKVKEEEHFSSGAWSAQLIGGFAGAVTSPSSYIPFATGVKYSSIAQNVIKNTLKAAPSVALQTVAHEGFMQATDAGGNLEDFAVNSLRDAVFGTAFIAAGAGIGGAYRGGKLWNTRKLMSYNYKGIEARPFIDEQGNELLRAVPVAGENISAAAVNEAQRFIDNAMSEGFLFAIPGVTKLAGNKLLGSPIVRGLSHKSAVVREFTDRMASHSILTNRILKGEAKADSAEDILHAIQADAVSFGLSYRGHFYEENGIIGGHNFKNAAKALKQRALKQNTVSNDDFAKRVINVLLTQEFNETKSVNAVAKEYTNFTTSIYERFRKATGISEEILPVRTALGYYTQNYHIMEVVKRPDEFVKIIADEYKAQDELISKITAPLEEAKAFLKQLEEHKLSGEGFDRSLAAEIKQAKLRVQTEMQRIEQRARDDENVAIILEDRNFLTTKEAEHLRSLLKPRDELQAKISEQERKLSSLKASKSSAKTSAKKTVTKKSTIKNIEKIKSVDAQIKALEDEIESLKRQMDDVVFELEQKAHAGEIPRNYFTKDQHLISFRNPDEWARFRKVFASDDERIAEAKAFKEAITNHTTEQVLQSVLGSMMPSMFANPIKERRVLIPSKLLNDNNFLMRDIPMSATAYARTLGRHIGLREAFGDLNFHEGDLGPIGIVRLLGEERAREEAKIANIKDEEERQKAFAILDKEFNEAREFMRNMHETYMGITRAKASSVRFARAVRNFAAATKLGGVPIAQITDVGAIVLKHGFWPFLRDGLKPFVETLNTYVKSEKSDAIRQNAAHALLAQEHLADGYAKKFYDSGSVGDVPVSTHLENALDNLAHLSGNFYGTNQIENLNQRWTANIMQSKIMKWMFDYRNGNLKENDRLALLTYGLDPKLWSERFIKNFEEAGGYSELGGYQSFYYKWRDAEAVNRMAMTLRRGVYDTIVQRGLFTSPFWTNDPILGMIFMFHGWGFSAFAKYTVPLMQRAQADKLLGIGVMLSLGALADPLRRLANGKPFNTEDDDTWFAKAFMSVSNSGVLGHTPEMFQVVNKLTGGQIAPSLISEKYRGINKAGALVGPVGGIASDLTDIVQDVLSGRINQKDVKKALSLVPGTNAIFLRQLLNHYTESLDLPETRRTAQPWSWRE